MEPEGLRQYSDDRHLPIVEGDGPANDGRIASEPPSREVVCHEHDVRLAGPGQAPRGRHGTGQGPEILGHRRRIDAGGAGCRDQSLIAGCIGNHPVERLRLIAPVYEVRPDDQTRLALCPDRGQPDEPLSVRVPERPHDDRVEDAEDRRVHPDRDRQRQDDNRGEAEVPADGPHRKADVLQQMLQHHRRHVVQLRRPTWSIGTQPLYAPGTGS